MALANIKAAIIERMLANATMIAVTTRIGSVHKKSWGAEPGRMILLRLAGSPGEENWAEVGFQQTRIDMEFYGVDPDDANLVWRTAHIIICPQQGSSQLYGFTASSCKVVSAVKESGPGEFIDPVTNLPFTLATYVFLWNETPTN